MRKQIPTALKKRFTQDLLAWFATHERPLPWKGEKNPYLIWLSEIILQQTRVEQGLPYFERFRAAYPKVEDLANAPEDEVMKQWEGLGYYSRARNLHFTAKYIARELEGVFPTTYETILSLKGVGTYTAAAIASFAYDLPYAVLDGNVYRVLARYFGIETAIDSTNGKKEFQALAQELLASEHAADYNQAIMDFGATVCKPKQAACGACPFRGTCTALADNSIGLLPYKAKKLKKKDRYFNYVIVNQEASTVVQKRLEKDIWQNLYQFPLIEMPTLVEKEDLIASTAWGKLFGEQKTIVRDSTKVFKQTLSHQKIIARFWEVDLDAAAHFDTKNNNYLIVERKNLNKFAFPKIIDWYFQDNSLFLF